MTLAVGDLCTVVYAEGGVRVALPVEIAGVNQQAFLSDYQLSQTGVPLRLRSVTDIAATVAEDPDDPRLLRVVGTIVRDAENNPFFAPLGAMPTADPLEERGAKVFFVVFADTSPILLTGGGTVQLPQAFVYRTPGEFDYYEMVSFGALGGSFRIIKYAKSAIDAVHLGNGWFREFYSASPITVKLRTITFFSDSEQTYTGAVQLGGHKTYQIRNGSVHTRTGRFRMSTWLGELEVTEINLPPIQGSRTFQTEYTYYPTVLQQLRQSLTQWTTPPKALVYHVPLQSDAVEGTPSEILPLGTTDYEPLEIINGDYPSAAAVVAKIASEAGEDGIREIRFFTALASLDAAARASALISEIRGAIDAAYEDVTQTVAVAPNNNWLGALAASATQIPT